MKEQASRSYKTKNKLTLSYILIFKFSNSTWEGKHHGIAIIKYAKGKVVPVLNQLSTTP
jgi:hypothetical protein